MVERAKTPYSVALKAATFKKTDVVVFDRMYGVGNDVAAQTLIEAAQNGFHGRLVGDAPSRKQAAQAVFEAKFGKPTTGMLSIAERDEKRRVEQEKMEANRREWLKRYRK